MTPRRPASATTARFGRAGAPAAALAVVLCFAVSTMRASYATDRTSTVASPTATPSETERVPQPLASSPASVGENPSRAAPPQTSGAADTREAAAAHLVLTASSLDALGLTYVGTFEVSEPSGSAQILRFTLTSGTLAAMRFAQPCADGATTVTAAESAELGTTTFDAVSLAGRVGSALVTFTVSDPPTSAFPGEVVLQDLTLTATTVSAATLRAGSFTTQVVAC